MATYIEQYESKQNEMAIFRHSIMQGVVNLLKTKTNPIKIGHYYYYYTNKNGEEVPAYCPIFCYDGTNECFMPIYNEKGEKSYGWLKFEDCCRIFDRIREEITKM